MCDASHFVLEEECETDLEIIPTQCKFVIHVVLWIYINKLYSRFSRRRRVYLFVTINVICA